MFDWFKKYTRPKYPTWGDVPPWDADIKKVGEDMNNIIPFPEAKSIPPMPQTVAPQPKPSLTCYRIGMTDDRRVSMQIGYNEVTMNSIGLQQLIDQLELFKSQIEEDEECDA